MAVSMFQLFMGMLFKVTGILNNIYKLFWMNFKIIIFTNKFINKLVNIYFGWFDSRENNEHGATLWEGCLKYSMLWEHWIAFENYAE